MPNTLLAGPKEASGEQAETPRWSPSISPPVMLAFSNPTPTQKKILPLHSGLGVGVGFQVAKDWIVFMTLLLSPIHLIPPKFQD